MSEPAKSFWEVYGPLVAAGSALLGVLIGGLFNWLTTKAQLKHAAREATRAREFQVRRDVYLDAAEGIASGNAAIGSMLDPTTLNADILSAFRTTLGRLAKAYVIGTVETLTAIKDYSCAFNDASGKLWPLRSQILSLIGLKQALQRTFDEAIKDRVRWIEAMKQHNVQVAGGPPGHLQETFDMLVQQSEYAKGNAARAQAKQSALDNVLSELQGRAIQTLVPELMTLQRLLPAALSAARREMELGIDDEKIRALFEDAAIRGEASLRMSLELAQKLTAEFQPKVEAALADKDESKEGH